MIKWQVQRELEREARMKILATQKSLRPPNYAVPTCDGEAIATLIEENAIGAGLKNHRELSEFLDLPFTAEMPPTCQMIKKLVTVSQNDEGAAEKLMEERRMYLMLMNVQGSVKSVRSGIKCWVIFATSFLGCTRDNSIPPASGHHVSKWCCLF